MLEVDDAGVPRDMLGTRRARIGFDRCELELLVQVGNIGVTTLANGPIDRSPHSSAQPAVCYRARYLGR